MSLRQLNDIEHALCWTRNSYTQHGCWIFVVSLLLPLSWPTAFANTSPLSLMILCFLLALFITNNDNKADCQ